MAINNVLPLKAAWRDAIANLKCFWGHPGTPASQFRQLHYAAPPHSARISSIYLLPFGKVWLGSVCWSPCATPGNEAERTIYGGCAKTPVLFNRLWTNVHEILGQCRKPLVFFSAPLPDRLSHVSFRRYSPLSLEVVENPNKCTGFFAPNYLGETTPTWWRWWWNCVFYRALKN